MPPQVYRRLVNTSQNSSAPEKHNSQTIGMRIMKKAGRITLPHGMPTLMAAFRDVMLETSFSWTGCFSWTQEPRFTWTPGSAGNNAGVGAQVLDGERTFGECGVLANALLCLLRCPDPYGFGERGSPDAELKVITYKGREEQGFIARHEGTIYQLESNVLNPENDAEKMYYFWDNHKVLQYNNSFWDVCYQREYTDPEQMAEGGMIVNTEHRGNMLAGGYLVYQVETAQGTVFYVNNNRRRDISRAHVIGPYNGDPGPPPEGTNEGPPEVRKLSNCCVIL